MSLHYLGNMNMNPGNCLFSHAVYRLENDTALACYIFDTHQPIIIIFRIQ